MVKNKLRFNWSLDYRRLEKSWPAPYRLRILPNKQERQEYRVTVYGNSEDEARQAAVDEMNRIDAVDKQVKQ